MPSSRIRERFTVPEVTEVLKQALLGTVEKVHEFERGSSKSPKVVVTAGGKRWLLKRRSPTAGAPARIGFCHALQLHLARAGLPVTAPVPFRDGSTWLPMGEHAYEIFPFVEGDRFDRSVAQTLSVGRVLGRLLRACERLQLPGDGSHGSFHASESILGALRMAPESVVAREPQAPAEELTVICAGLRRAYREAAHEANAAGFPAFLPQVIHGDFHPGNLLFRRNEVVAILDFDSARLEPRSVEVANALLQFSAPSLSGLAIAQWPDSLEWDRLQALVQGLGEAATWPEPAECQAIPWLIIEACIAECSVPIAKTGSFADLRGSEFLRYMERRTAWIRAQVAELAAGLSRRS